MTVFCDECINFPQPNSKRWGDCTKRIYLCDRGILMGFVMPSSPIDDEWGFQKERCAHFVKKTKDPIVYGIRGVVPRKKS